MTGIAAIHTAQPDDTDARFAAYLDDPQLGPLYRAFLDDDPQTQRALFDLAEAMTANPGPLPGSLLWAAWCPVLLITAVLLVRFLL